MQHLILSISKLCQGQFNNGIEIRHQKIRNKWKTLCTTLVLNAKARSQILHNNYFKLFSARVLPSGRIFIHTFCNCVLTTQTCESVYLSFFVCGLFQKNEVSVTERGMLQVSTCFGKIIEVEYDVKTHLRWHTWWSAVWCRIKCTKSK